MRLFALALLLVGCSNGTTVDGGTDAPAEGSSSEAGTCGISLCTPYGTTSAECPKCAPANNGACTPAGITCDYSNGCSSGALNTAFCTCIVPDAGADAAVDGGGRGAASTERDVTRSNEHRPGLAGILECRR